MKKYNIENYTVTLGEGHTYEIYSERTGYRYELLEVFTPDKTLTTDIITIMQALDDVGYTGMLDWVFGASFIGSEDDFADSLLSCVKIIEEFESNHDFDKKACCLLSDVYFD